MFWVFLVGLAFTYVISHWVGRLLARFLGGIEWIAGTHGVSIVIAAVLTTPAASVYGFAISPIYLLCAWFLPQCVWLFKDMTRFTVKEIKASSFADLDQRGLKKASGPAE
ncbi:hypothetical protein JM93_00952 [Roseibium hamelinense]|uniref:Uncharacterized protein n=1 Tax=Roseibium hamelinense TaxID=150831 RepID=A0A562TIC8_9HYPH|nr:hypothetical protein [Roseibium hamelinense]MTI42749.1 hypothetical protein [Roseibium hamelinense]TWI93395.1 hypothetical protein JM93_00952 [Roseibium hamelinense]